MGSGWGCGRAGVEDLGWVSLFGVRVRVDQEKVSVEIFIWEETCGSECNLI